MWDSELSRSFLLISESRGGARDLWEEPRALGEGLRGGGLGDDDRGRGLGGEGTDSGLGEEQRESGSG